MKEPYPPKRGTPKNLEKTWKIRIFHVGLGPKPLSMRNTSKNLIFKNLYLKRVKKQYIINFMDITNILNDLVNSLKVSDPYKIILFGSYANGNETENSDIDLMVILDNNDVSKTYEERQNKKLYIRKLVREINYRKALDILVYSKEELKKIKEYGNYFIDEIEKTGKVLYEKVS